MIQNQWKFNHIIFITMLSNGKILKSTKWYYLILFYFYLQPIILRQLQLKMKKNHISKNYDPKRMKINPNILRPNIVKW